MAIKISGNTVIDDSQNITATGSATFGGVGTGAESVKLIGRSSDDRADLQFYENDGSTFIASLSAQLDSMNLFLGSSSGELKITGNQTIFRSEIGAERARINSSGMGIGTTSPAATLHLNKSGTSDYTTLFLSNSGASGRSYQIGVGGNTAGAGYANNLYIYDNSVGQPRVVLDSSGNVKIGGTLSSPNINLNADGSATFTSTNPVVIDQPSSGNSANPSIQIKHNGTINGSWRHDGRFEVGGQDADAEITLSPDGSASFAGVVTGTADYNTFTASVTLANEGSSFRSAESSAGSASKYHFFGSANGTNVCHIATDGSATFASSVSATVGDFTGNVTSDRTSSSHTCFNGKLNGTTTSEILADGSATFSQFDTSSNSGNGASIDINTGPGGFGGVRVQSTDTATTVGEFFAGYRGTSSVFQVLTSGNATFAGTITANGYSLANLTQLT